MNERFTTILFKYVMLIFGFTLASYQIGQAQTCNDNVQISVAPMTLAGTDLCGVVTRDHFLEGDATITPHVIEIDGVESPEITLGGETFFDVDWVQHIGQTIEYKIIDAATSNSCWGSAKIEANVFDSQMLPCKYTPAIHEIIEVETGDGNLIVTESYADLGIEIDASCQTPIASVEGDAKYPCDDGNDGIPNNADDGWCTIECTVVGTATGFTVTLTPPVGSTAPDEVICEVHVKADECVDCETWCAGDIYDDNSTTVVEEIEEMTVAEMKTFLSTSCFASVSQVFKNEQDFGDACSGLTKVVKWSAMVDQHGTDVLVPIGTQAFKVSPLDLFIDDPDLPTGMVGDPLTGSGRICNIYKPAPAGADPSTGSGILILPSPTMSLNCGDDPSDLDKTGQPLIVNHHGETIDTSCTEDIFFHYKEVVAKNENSPVLIDGVWALATVLEKETKDVQVCDCADIQPILDRYVSEKADVLDVTELINISSYHGIVYDADEEKWTCTDWGEPDDDTDGLKDLTHEITTKPYKTYTFDELSKYSCNTLLSTYSNDTIPACGTGIKILRKWTLVDWCTSETKDIEQLIEVSDKNAPTIDKDPQEITVSIEPWVCTAPISEADPGFEDDCGNDFDVAVEVIDNASGIWVDPAGGLPIGDYTVQYRATDLCGNVSKPYEVTYHIVDHVKPVAVCEDQVVVSLTKDNDGDGALAKIYAETFDRASHDGGCAEIQFKEVIRMDHLEGGLDCNPYVKEVHDTTFNKFGEIVEIVTTEKAVFGPHVKFCCADEGDQLVVLRVWDGISADGSYGAGNYNDCMVRVTVQNKLSADLACTDMTIECTEYDGDPTAFGGYNVGGSDCAPGDVEELDPVVDINSCGVGSIIRTFVLANGQLCRSTITVTGDGSFDPTTIKWPLHHIDEVLTVVTKEEDTREDSDTYGDCIVTGEDTYTTTTLSCGEDAAPCEPTWTSDACGLVGVSHTDEIVEFDKDACYKIIRRWAVVDWCTWSPNDGENNETLDDENDTGRDTYFACSDWCTTEACNTYYRYDEVEEDGYYTFDQVIKVVDEIAPEVTCDADAVGIGVAGGCVGDITFSATGVDGSECPSEVITYSWTVKDSDDAEIASGTGSSGSVEGIVGGAYTVHFTASDGCGNTGYTSCEVTLKEEKAPTPYCYAIATAVMNNGMVEIWASDFIQKGEDNCTAEEDLLASFSGTEYEPNLVLTCDDVTGREKNIRIWLWDAAGNADFCVQTVRVDSNGHCDEDTDDGDDNDGESNVGCDGTIGGVLITDPTDLDAVTICAGDGVSDAFDAKVWEKCR